MFDENSQNSTKNTKLQVTSYKFVTYNRCQSVPVASERLIAALSLVIKLWSFPGCTTPKLRNKVTIFKHFRSSKQRQDYPNKHTNFNKSLHSRQNSWASIRSIIRPLCKIILMKFKQTLTKESLNEMINHSPLKATDGSRLSSDFMK